VMYAGRVVEEAPTQKLYDTPAHPYTKGLLGSTPPIDGPRRPLSAIRGEVPEPWAIPPGCAFAPRCARSDPACSRATPDLASIRHNQRAACIRPVNPSEGNSL
jgi:peptide/nickel transport system ATP-binding protein